MTDSVTTLFDLLFGSRTVTDAFTDMLEALDRLGAAPTENPESVEHMVQLATFQASDLNLPELFVFLDLWRGHHRRTVPAEELAAFDEQYPACGPHVHN